MSKPIVCTSYPIIFSVKGRTYISPVQGEGWLEVPFGTTLDDIEFITTNTVATNRTENKREDRWVWHVEGDSGKEYVIVKDGLVWSCSCPGFMYRQTCKHVIREKAKWEHVLK